MQTEGRQFRPELNRLAGTPSTLLATLGFSLLIAAALLVGQINNLPHSWQFILLNLFFKDHHSREKQRNEWASCQDA